MSSKDKFEISDLSQINPRNQSIIQNNYISNIDVESQNNKKVNNRSWISKLRSAKRNNSNKKIEIKVDCNMEGMGTIELAKLHRDANRPLKKIKEFDEKVEFCPCCSLPKEKKGYIEEFSFNADTDEFNQCGMGIPLYFSFFRFCLIILIFSFLSISLPTIIYTNFHTSELVDECNKIGLKEEINNISFFECINFAKIDGKSNYSLDGSDWALRFNGMNLKLYKLLHFHLTYASGAMEETILNYSLVNFISLISLFIINLFYIVLIYNINKRNNMLVTTPGDYTAMISNLSHAFEIFFKKINKINKLTLKNINISNINETDKISKEKNIFVPHQNYIKNKEISDLGLDDFSKDQEINILEGFYNFIKNKICVSADGEKYNVSHINICYKIEELKKLEDKIQDKKSKILKIQYDPKQIIKNEEKNLKDKDRRYFAYLVSVYGINLLQIEKCKSMKLSELEKKQSKLEEEMDKLFEQSKNLTKENFTGVIFVTFKTKQDKEKFLAPYPEGFVMFLLKSIFNLRYYICGCLINKGKKKRFFLQRNMAAESAPEPEEIQFENLAVSSYERLCRTFLIYFISVVIISFSFMLISRLNLIQKNIKSNNAHYNGLIKYAISLLITIVISIINIILEILLEILTKLEKHITMTNYYLSFSIKLTLFTFITSAIIPLVANFLHNNGDCDLLVTNMSIMFLTNGFVTPVMWTLNFKYFLKKFIQFIIERKKKQNSTQRELNNLYELPDMKISNKYSYLAKTLLMTFLYIPIFPLGILISLLGFILGYFLEKYNFINMYKRPEMLSSNLCSFYSNYFVCNFFMLGLGDYLFLQDNYNNAKWTLININIFALLIIIPYNQILKFDFIGIKESELKTAKNYDEEYFQFYNDYERSNPMTKREGMKRFIFKLKEKGFINTMDEAIYKTIDNANLMEIYYKSKKNLNNSMIQREFCSKNSNNFYENIIKHFCKNNALKNIIFNKVIKNEDSNLEKSIHEENISENDSIDLKPINNLNTKNLLTNYLNKNINNIIINNNININININNNSNAILNEETINNTKITAKEYNFKNVSIINNINNNSKKNDNSLINNDNNNEININNGNDIILEFEEKKDKEIEGENIDNNNLEKKITNFMEFPKFVGKIYNSNLKNDKKGEKHSNKDNSEQENIKEENDI